MRQHADRAPLSLQNDPQPREFVQDLMTDPLQAWFFALTEFHQKVH